MAALCLDTSALGRVLLREPDASAILSELKEWEQLVASRLLRLELRRLALRHDLLGAAERLLGGVSLVPITEASLMTAETVEPVTVATLDAIHLSTAIGLRDIGVADTLMTFDRQLAAGAEANGLRVLAPG